MIDDVSMMTAAGRAASLYPAPYRIVSDDSRDVAAMAAWAPGERATIQHAAGVAHDLRHAEICTGVLTVLDATGAPVPLHLLREVLTEGRHERRGIRS